MALYYSDAGPGPAFKLIRVHATEGGTFAQWLAARAQRWNPGGWYDYPKAQTEILWSGEIFMVDATEVPAIKRQVAAHYEVVA